MQSKLLVAGLLVASFALVPTVGADHVTACKDVADESDVTIPASESGEAGDLYLDADTPGLFQESNELPGLQTESGACDDDGDDEIDVKYDADSQLAPPAAP